MSDDSETAQDQGLVNRVRASNEIQKVGPTCAAPGSGGRNALAALQGRIRNLVAAFGGASRLARQLAEEFGDSIGESGVRAWTAQGNIPLRRRHQLARLGRSNDLLVDVVTLEVHFGPTGGDVGDFTHLGTAAFLSLDEVAARWRLPRDRVRKSCAQWRVTRARSGRHRARGVHRPCRLRTQRTSSWAYRGFAKIIAVCGPGRTGDLAPDVVARTWPVALQAKPP